MERTARSHQRLRSRSLKTRGTRAARGGLMFRPNCRARSYPNEVAPIFAMDKTPVATTRRDAPKLVSSAFQGDLPSFFAPSLPTSLLRRSGPFLFGPNFPAA